MSPLADLAVDDERALGPVELLAQLVEREVDRTGDGAPGVLLARSERRPVSSPRSVNAASSSYSTTSQAPVRTFSAM